MTQPEHGLDFWRERVAGVQLPVLSDAAACEALLLPTASLQEIGRRLAADPPLALDVLRAAARVTNRRDDVQGLQHAMAILGVERIQAIARVRMKRPFDPANPAHVGVAQALAVNRFAGMLVDGWEVNKIAGASDFLAWVTQLLGLARSKLPLAAPAQWRAIEQRVARGEHRARVEQELLGVRIEDLNQALLVHGGFAEDEVMAGTLRVEGAVLALAARYAWSGEFAPELPPPLARSLRNRNLRASLASLLAWSAWDGWYSRRTLSLLRVVSACLGQPLDSVITTTHQIAARASRSFVRLGCVRSPAESVFWPPLPRRRLVARRAALPTVASPVACEQGEAPQPVAQGATRPDPKLVAAFIGNCRDGHYRDLRELVAALPQTLADGVGLSRCLLLLNMARSESLVGYLAQGFMPPVVPRELVMLVSDENLVTRVFNQSGSLWINPARLPAARRQLPPVLERIVPAGGFLVSGLRLQARPVGVLWADGGNGAPPGEAQYADFRRIAQHFGGAFARLAEPRRA